MTKFQRGPDGEQCQCGRPDRTSRVVDYRSRSGRFRYHRCDCGTEWTERVPHVDRTVPISGDEVLDVHLLLADFEGDFTELIDHRRT